MKVTYGTNSIKRFKNPVVALGVFDGVHRGHKNILRAAVKKAHGINGTSIALTFWPHPQKEESLYSLEHRLRLIAGLGIDVCAVINFNQNFARIKAEDFVKNVLFKKIHARYIFVGKNFRFGRNASGDFKLLFKKAKAYNFKLQLFNVIKFKNEPISSTAIRKLIKKGELSTAQKLLSRPVSILGTVIKGASLGKRLGFPTANINPHHEVIPPNGVYAVWVIYNDRKLRGICYIGRRPTLKSQEFKKVNIEVHILNFNKYLYYDYLEIQFIKKIREEIKFPSLVALAKQVQKDIKIIQ